METVNCENSKVSKLFVKGCVDLDTLDCHGNLITELDASDCRNLIYLHCQDNELSSLKFGSGLKVLEAWDNKLEELDLTGNTMLRELYCSNNGITDLDISDCPYLITVYNEDLWSPSDNAYTTWISTDRIVLNVDKDEIKIKTTDADMSEKVVEINKDNFPDEYFRKVVQISDTNHDGWLSKIEIARTYQVMVEDPKAKSIEGIKYLSGIREFYCMQDTLKEIDLSANTSLEGIYLDYFECNVEKLNITGLTRLRYLTCSFGNLSTLDISTNKDLVGLCCEGNPLAELDISNNELLIKAYLEGEKEEYINQNISVVSYKDYSTGAVLYCNKDTVIKYSKPTPTATPTATPIPTAIPAATATPASAPVTTAVPTTADPVSLALNKKTAKVTCGKTLTLKATLTGSTDKITWKSSDTKIATVDASGKIKAKMAGEVTITATAAGKTAKCVVTVLYKDVTNSKDFWYAPTNYLTAKGVVKGYDKQTKFKPANKCTRAQMVTFIWRLQGEPKPKASKCKFSDVKKSDYFYKACIWGNENHIVEGYKNGTFGPQIVCARKHAVTFLWRLANKPKPSSTKNRFKDVKKSDYFYQATLWASEKKILAGYSDGTFRPNGDCLRRQMVTFLYKFDKYINKKG